MICKLTLADKSNSFSIKIPQTFQDLCHQVFQKLNIKSFTPFSLKYKDSDDELIMLNNQEDLQTAILTLKVESLTCLEIIVFQDKLPNQEQPQKASAKVPYKHLQSMPVNKKNLLTQEVPLQKAKSFFQRNSLKHQTDPIFERFSSYKAKNAKIPLGLPQLEGRRKHKSFSFGPSQQDRPGNKRLLSTCFICKKIIREAHFICLSCPNKFFCESCETSTLHPHRLLKVNGPSFDPLKVPFKRVLPKSHNNSPTKTGLVKKNVLYKSGGVGKSSFMEASKLYEEEHRVEFHSAPEDMEVQTGKTFEYEFSLVNSGEKQWPVGVKFVCINGTYKGKTMAVPPLPPQKKYVMSLSLPAAGNIGKQLSQWQLHYQDGNSVKAFKNSFFLKLKGVEKK